MEVLHLAGVDVVVADLRVDLALETPAEGALEVGGCAAYAPNAANTERVKTPTCLNM
jgi:hypothetical protein